VARDLARRGAKRDTEVGPMLSDLNLLAVALAVILKLRSTL
jgi:hypothetical protein